MAFVPADAVKLLIKGGDEARPWSMAFWAVKAVPAVPTESELAAIASAVAGVIPGNAFLGFMSANIKFTEVEARDASVMRGPNVVESITAQGTVDAAGGPAMAAKVIVNPATTVFQFRPSQTFIPGLPSNAFTADDEFSLTDTYIAAANAFIGTIAAAIASVSSYALGAVSKNIHGGPRPGGAQVSQASSHTIRKIVATQVRRQRRVTRR